MTTPDKWLFFVDSTTAGQKCFKLTTYPQKRQNCGLSDFGVSLRYFMAGFPIEKSWTDKTPEFALQQEQLLKNLKSSGYTQIWTIRGGLENDSSGDTVEHTTGRKRKRQPTLNLPEGDQLDETETNQRINSPLHRYRNGLLIGLPHGQVVDYRIEISQILSQHQFKTELEFERLEDEHWQCEYEGQSYQLVGGITSATQRPIHPAFRDPDSNLLFHSKDQVLEVFKKCCNESCFRDVRRWMPVLEADTGDLSLHHPFVVIEGMDATGKSTLVKRLCEQVGATQLSSPPTSLRAVKGQFQGVPPLYRRVYYSMGNYMAAIDILQQCASGPVIMDRFWHSSAAYTIASHCCGDIDSLPPPDNSVYQWPEDLPSPSLVVLLSVSEGERDRRMKERLDNTGDQLTQEEGSLKQSRLLRQRIMEAYKRIRGPRIVEVDANGTREDVLQSVMQQLRDHNILSS